MIGKLRAVVVDACILAVSNAEEEDRHGKLNRMQNGPPLAQRMRNRECARAGGVDSWHAERSTPGFYGPMPVDVHINHVTM